MTLKRRGIHKPVLAKGSVSVKRGRYCQNAKGGLNDKISIIFSFPFLSLHSAYIRARVASSGAFTNDVILGEGVWKRRRKMTGEGVLG